MKSEEQNNKPVTSQKRKGFSIGPAHLPDGVRKRKADKIKRDLIHKAKVKKEYAKIRERELVQQPNVQQSDTSEKGKADNSGDQQSLPTMKRHPDRENMINDLSLPTYSTDSQPSHNNSPPNSGPRHRQKPIPFRKESLKAKTLRAELEERRKCREEAELQKMQKLQERERMRKAIFKARKGGCSGQRKLGRESRILLQKVKKIVAEP